ncbi:hypothetical protein AAMO2058_001106500 [Amorphochlora amoebiformis]
MQSARELQMNRGLQRGFSGRGWAGGKRARPSRQPYEYTMRNRREKGHSRSIHLSEDAIGEGGFDDTKVCRIAMLGRTTPQSKDYALNIQDEMNRSGIRAGIVFLEHPSQLSRETQECTEDGYSFLAIADERDMAANTLGLRYLQPGHRKELTDMGLDDVIDLVFKHKEKKSLLHKRTKDDAFLIQLRDQLTRRVSSRERKRGNQIDLTADDDIPTDPRRRTPSSIAPSPASSAIPYEPSDPRKRQDLELKNNVLAEDSKQQAESKDETTKLNISTLEGLLNFFESNPDEHEDGNNLQIDPKVGVDDGQYGLSEGLGNDEMSTAGQGPGMSNLSKSIGQDAGRGNLVGGTKFTGARVKPQNVCWDWQRSGQCNRGANCRYAHILHETPNMLDNRPTNGGYHTAGNDIRENSGNNIGGAMDGTHSRRSTRNNMVTANRMHGHPGGVPMGGRGMGIGRAHTRGGGQAGGWNNGPRAPNVEVCHMWQTTGSCTRQGCQFLHGHPGMRRQGGMRLVRGKSMRFKSNGMKYGDW